MSPDIINVGSSPNDGQGDPIRTAFIKTNANFSTLFALPNPTPPATLVGKAGDVPGMYAYNSNYFYYCFGTWNGSSTIWAQVSQINSVSVNKINNGTSNVSIAGANANVTITVDSIANLATFSTVGLSVNGNITGNYYIGNGSQLTGIVGDYGNANVSAFLPTYSGNLGAITAVGNVNTVSFFVGDGSYLTNLTPTTWANISNIVGANGPTNVAIGQTAAFSGQGANAIAIGSQAGSQDQGNFSIAIGVSAAEAFQGSNAIAIGSLAGLFQQANNTIILNATGGNVSGTNGQANSFYVAPVRNDTSNTANIAFYNASTYEVTYANTISTTGNISAGYFIGDGSQLTNLPTGNYGNANVADYLPTYTGNITANIISATGNVYTDGFFVGNFAGNISGNLIVPGANTQVLYNDNGNAGASAGLTFDSGSNVLASTGNISTTGNVIALAMYTSSVVSAGGNVRGSNFNTTGIVSATGNVYGDYFVGNITGSVANAVFANTANVAYSVAGANVTGNVANATFATTAGSSNTAATVTTNAQPNITSVGTLTSLSVTGNVTANNIIANSFVTSNGFFKLPSYTTIQIGALTGMTGGEMVYDSDLQIVQAYQLNPATSTMGWVSWTVAVYQ